MPRGSDTQAQARREQVAELWVRGASMSRIAKAVGADRETIRRDLAVISRQAVAEVDVPRELVRLLRGAQALEVAGWGEKQYGVVLGAQKAQLGVLQVVQGLDVARRVEALEQRLDALTGGPVAGAGGSHGAVLVPMGNGAAQHGGGVP